MKFRAEDLHSTYCRYFRTNLLFRWSIFYDTKINRTAIYRKTFIDVSCIMITYPISSNLCKKISLQCYRLYNFPSFRSSHWRWLFFVRKGVLRNFAKFTGKSNSLFTQICWLRQLLLIFLVSSLEFLVYFISSEKWNEKREIPCLLFYSSIDFFDVKNFKRN